MLLFMYRAKVNSAKAEKVYFLTSNRIQAFAILLVQSCLFAQWKSNISRTAKNTLSRGWTIGYLFAKVRMVHDLKRSVHWSILLRIFSLRWISNNGQIDCIYYDTTAIDIYICSDMLWPVSWKENILANRDQWWVGWLYIWSAIQYTIQVRRFIDDRFFTGLLCPVTPRP